MVSRIEWTTETWNPTTGCNKVSRGCKNCYAEKMHKRLKGMKEKGYEEGFLKGAVEQPHTLTRPLKWKSPQRIFVNSMSDLFHENVSFDFIDKVIGVMYQCPQHTFQVLTKRPEIMLEWSKRYWKTTKYYIPNLCLAYRLKIRQPMMSAWNTSKMFMRL